MMQEDRMGRRFAVVFAAGLALLVLLLIGNTCMGSVRIPPKQLWDTLTGGKDTGNYQSILWKIRLPRICAAVLLGGALGVSGFLLQTFFHNPIAGPFVLGISSGAKMTVAAALFVTARFGLSQIGPLSGSWMMIVAAWAGSALVTGCILVLSSKTQHTSSLIVTGVMTGYLCSAVTDLLTAFGDENNIVNLHDWSVGSFSGAAWDDVAAMACVVALCTTAAFFLAKPIGAYRLGEEYAQNMGVNIRRLRFLLILLSSLLSACVTAFAGPVSFVGVAVPHVVKTILKTSRPVFVIPMCFVGGAAFCLGCDLIARTAFAPQQLSISAVTGIFGAPVVIGMLVQKRKREVE